MNKNYLPSKKFVYALSTIILFGLMVFAISYFLGGKSKYSSSGENKLSVGKLTLNEMIQKDSDNDGVADWEEALWGTDPNKQATFDGVSDKEYIKKRRAELNLTGGSTNDGGALTETDKFSQEFFASFMAMKQNGQIDSNTINNVSSALGQKITDPTLTDIYTENDVKLAKEDTKRSQENYYLTVRDLFGKYQKNGIGTELLVVENIASTDGGQIDPTDNEKLLTISKAYIDFSKAVIQLPVPKSISAEHLKIANASNNTGVSVENMSKTNDDPIIGLSGLSQYKKYSDDLISAVSDLEAVLLKN